MDGGGRLVADAVDPARAAWSPCLDDRHLVLGQCAGLVGADESGGAQCLHRLEVPDKGVSLAHSLRTDGQRQGDGRQQSLRYDRHRHTNCEQKAVGNLHANQHRDGEEGGSDADSDEGDNARHPRQFQPQRSRRMPLRLSEGGDGGQPGLRTRAHDVGASLPFHDKASGGYHVTDRWMFGDAFTRQRRGVNGEPCDAVNRRIRRNPGALRQQLTSPTTRSSAGICCGTPSRSTVARRGNICLRPSEAC